jgi:hypothetical protein
MDPHTNQVRVISRTEINLIGEKNEQHAGFFDRGFLPSRLP